MSDQDAMVAARSAWQADEALSSAWRSTLPALEGFAAGWDAAMEREDQLAIERARPTVCGAGCDDCEAAFDEERALADALAKVLRRAHPMPLLMKTWAKSSRDAAYDEIQEVLARYDAARQSHERAAYAAE